MREAKDAAEGKSSNEGDEVNGSLRKVASLDEENSDAPGELTSSRGPNKSSQSSI